VSVVYGDDQTDKSYREAQGLFKSYPNLKAIVAPTTVGVAAACQGGRMKRKSVPCSSPASGCPSEMAGHVKSGAVKSVAIWNPIDLGIVDHGGTPVRHRQGHGQAGEKVSLGRRGHRHAGRQHEAAMAEPFTYDAGNVDKFAKFF